MASLEQKNKLAEWGLEGNHFSNKDDFDGWVTENEGDADAMTAVLAWVRGGTRQGATACHQQRILASQRRYSALCSYGEHQMTKPWTRHLWTMSDRMK